VDLVEWLRRHIEWSRRTFGPGRRTKGLAAHIRKELEEIERDPTDPVEWLDVAILAFDGAWRTAADPSQLVAGWDPTFLAIKLEEKQRANLARAWPPPKSEDEPIEHVRTADEVPAAAEVLDEASRGHQVGGTHYLAMAVQPWDAMADWMTPDAFRGFLRGNVVKYLARCEQKGGVEDLRKARHYLDRLIETYGA
jgi:hypothetical protein